MTRTQSRRRTPASTNGNGPSAQDLAAAIAHEDSLAAAAAEIRGDQTVLDLPLLMKLRPLLRKPIPTGFIQHVGVVTGKPYESTGVKSVQALIERMDAVLTPLWWWDEVVWLNQDGSLAEVTVHVGDREERKSLFSRTARGGVKGNPNPANQHKGTYTNAAKLAFARVGPGHEVYLGAADFDPDTDQSAADEQGRAPAAAPVETISAESFATLWEAFEQIPGTTQQKARKLKLKLGEMGVAGVSTVKTALLKLTPAQAAELDGWLGEQATAGGES